MILSPVFYRTGKTGRKGCADGRKMSMGKGLGIVHFAVKKEKSFCKGGIIDEFVIE